MQISLYGVLPVTFKIYSKSLIIPVKPQLKVTCQILVVGEWAPGTPSLAGEEMVMVCVSGWRAGRLAGLPY